MLLLGVLQAQAAGQVAGSYDLLETQVLASSAASVTFSGLSAYAADYQHLQIRLVARTNGINAFPGVRFNGDSGSNYANHSLQGNGSSVSSSADTSRTNAVIGALPWNGTTANAFGVIVLDILDPFNSSKNTTIRTLNGRGSATDLNLVRLGSGLWNNTASLTQVQIVNNFSDSFITGSRFSIYGLRTGA